MGVTSIYVASADHANDLTIVIEGWRARGAALDTHCRYDDCAGTFVDAIPWAEVRAKYPEHPTVPEVGISYPADKDLLIV